MHELAGYPTFVGYEKSSIQSELSIDKCATMARQLCNKQNGLGIGLPTPSATKYFIVNFSWHKLCDNIALKLIPPCKRGSSTAAATTRNFCSEKVA